ncbi:MAG: 4'-phosphopantetheinyl transferase superfamily protein [Gammaproteobacteria bacterium]|nr:MAG: 4'-phosphopantetheinyl transferase superfamily protein [Gammaproteobacteria bacterium]
MTAEPWRRVQQHPELAAGEIHVWRVRLDTPVTGESPLSADELQRAQRLRDIQKRNHFIAGRAALRDLLGEYTGTEPRELQFVYGPHGKPSLRDNPLRFNFSNSGEVALLAVASDREVGVDIEYRDRSIRVEPLAAHIFTNAEAAAFRQLPESKRHAALLAAWTRKEAYLKALGTGFSLSLNSFSVAVPVDEEPAVLELGDSPETMSSWKFVPLVPHPEYIATLTAPDTGWSVRRFDGN